MNILTIDVGTSSIRGILFSPAGKILAKKSIHASPIIEGSFIEQEPDAYRRAVVDICRELGGRFPVDAISLTGFRSAITLAGHQGEALCRFIMWQDRRNAALCEALQPFNPEIRARSGADLNPVFSATRILWLKQNQPEFYARCYKVMTVPDDLIRYMTGVFITDRSYGSRTHLMNIHTQEYDPRLLEIFSLDQEKLCPLCTPGDIVGHVTEVFGKETGLRPGLPVISAGGDQQCGALGLGVLEHGTAEINCGTGAFAIALTDQPEDIPGCICNVSAIPGKYILEANILTGASSLNWLRGVLFHDLLDAPGEFDRLNAMAADSPRGANGVYCLPHFQGCGARSWQLPAKAAFWGMTLSTSRGDLLRALYEGLAAEIAKSLKTMPLAADSPLLTGGGLSKSNLYLQILSDMTGRRILRYENAQATAIGAWASAQVTLGQSASYREALQKLRALDRQVLFSPDPEALAFYRRYQEETERIFHALWQK